MIATRLLVLSILVLVAATGVAAFASSSAAAGRPSHAALTEQARAYYKQYISVANSNDDINDASSCPNITAAPHFVTPQDLVRILIIDSIMIATACDFEIAF